MIQVWEIDSNSYFTGSSYFVEKALDNHVTKPLLVGYVKAKWTGLEWQEGATEEEIKNWEEQNKIDICTPKTNQELQEEIENLKAQLEAVHERLCTQQEMSSTVIAHVFGMEALKNE